MARSSISRPSCESFLDSFRTPVLPFSHFLLSLRISVALLVDWAVALRPLELKWSIVELFRLAVLFGGLSFGVEYML